MIQRAIYFLLGTSLLVTLNACGESLPLADILTSSEHSGVELQTIVNSFTALAPEEQQNLAQSSGSSELQTLMSTVQDLTPQERQTQVYQQLNRRPEMIDSLRSSTLAGPSYMSEAQDPGTSSPLRPERPLSMHANVSQNWNNNRPNPINIYQRNKRRN